MDADAPATSRRQINDGRLRDAALAEVVDHGADVLGPTAVARRAGLSTGAVYSRFEDTTELLVDLWSSQCRAACFAMADLAMHALSSQSDATARSEFIAAFTNPTPSMATGLELMVMAHRDDALAEVVIPDGSLMLASHGVTRSSDPDRKARAALVGCLVIGLLLMDSSGVSGSGDDTADVVNWEASLERLAAMLDRNPKVLGQLEVIALPDLPGLDGVDADPTRARLILACMEVIGRVGLQRATVTRIGRRAGMTHGAIYGLFDSKEELVAAAVGELTARILSDDRAANQQHLMRIGSYGATMSAVLAGFGDHRRTTWHKFRIECHLAQRHDATVAGALNRVYSGFMARDAVTFTRMLGMDLDLSRGWIRMQLAVPLGLALLQVLIPGAMDEVDWYRSVGLLG